MLQIAKQHCCCFCRLTKQAADAIEDVNSKYGLNLPVVVIGYRCVGRCAHWMLRACTLIRSDKLVINHIIAGFQNGRTCVDLKQMVMRGGGGRTRAVSLCLTVCSALAGMSMTACALNPFVPA